MDFDFLVIGGGVVGLAVAEYFSRSGHRVLLVEKEMRYGTGVSSRNSEVIHAGIYYPKGSLKSELCIKGKEMLYEWCRKNNIPHANTGKYIVATDNDELERLEVIRRRAAEAGMNELYFVSKDELNKNEPAISAVGALHSPTTGIVSAHGLMDSLYHRASESGAEFVFNSKVETVSRNASGYKACIADLSGETAEIEIGGIVNCAGLYSDQVAKLLGADDASYRLQFIKGNYFRLRGKSGLFKKLIYPVPMPKLHGLGVHITLDLNGSVRFGPDVEPLDTNSEDYRVDECRANDFLASIRKYYSAITPDDLMPDMAGIRPRLASEKDFNDFIIHEESSRGLPGVINCVGIESPGLTSSLAIAEYVYSLIK